MLDLFLMTALFAGGEPPTCPDLSAKPVPARTEVVVPQECGSGISVSPEGTSLRTNYCPLLVIVLPAHAVVQHSPGSNTYVMAAGQMPVQRLHYACETGFFLWILPILGSSCVFQGESNAGAVTHYVQHNCPVVEPLTETAR